MNILIPHSWLREFVKTDATPETIAEKLSLCSLSVEKLHKKANDTVYEIEITPNRYDTLSVLGIAREVAAVLPRFGIKAELHLKGVNSVDITKIGENEPNLLHVTITKPELCPRFTAVVLDRVEIKPSPKIIRDRLEMSGVRALNNVVDVSNYLMLELGQPMHIFDFDKLAASAGAAASEHAASGSERVDAGRGEPDQTAGVKEMILRESKKGEKIVTLDGIERELPKGAIVIESGGRLVDLCGIMGGKNSEVDENTKRILLFIQIYDPLRIRKTSQALALRTEASARFEKGLDPQGIIPAMNQAIKMLKENANANVASRLVDIQNETFEPHEVELEIPEVERLLGIRIEKEEIIKILKSLGFEVRVKNSAFQIPTVTAKVPSWRDKDIKIAEDLIEEVARLYGYHNLPNLMPRGAIPTVLREKKFYWEDRAKDFLKHQGFLEVYNYSFTSAEVLKKAGFDPQKSLKLRNPLSADLEYLRPSLLPSLLKNLSENQHLADELRFFELERVYLPQKGQELPRENLRLTGLIHHQQPATSNQLFYLTKGIIEGLLRELGIKNLKFDPQPPNAATIHSTNPKGLLGTIGYIDPATVFFDLDFDTIAKLASDLKTFEPIPEYPPIIEDLSIILPPKTFIADVITLIQKQSKLIREVKVVDIYPKKGSVTLRITYQHAKRTLTDKEVQKIRQKIINSLEKTLKAKIRKKD